MDVEKKVLDICPWDVLLVMARAATNFECFNAVAEPAAGPEKLSCNARTARGRDCGLSGPGTAVGFENTCAFCLEVGLVNVRRDGRRSCIENAEAIRPFTKDGKSSATGVIIKRVKERAEQKSLVKDTGRILLQGGKMITTGNKN